LFLCSFCVTINHIVFYLNFFVRPFHIYANISQMKPLTAVSSYKHESDFERTVLSLATSELVGEILVVCPQTIDIKIPKCRVVTGGALESQKVISQIINETKTRYLLFLTCTQQITIKPGALERLIEAAESKKAGMIYSDFYDKTEHREIVHPLNTYQLGSIRDDFDFGHVLIFSTEAIRTALQKYGKIPAVDCAGLYDLRLKISIDYPLYHFSEPLYSVGAQGKPSGDNQLFAYVDPRNTDVQKEMETVFTNYLKKIGAYIPQESLRRAGHAEESFPVEASVVIPVKNRCGTIRDAVEMIPVGLHDRLHPRNVPVMIGAPHVDEKIKPAPQLIPMVRNVGGEVRVIPLLLAHDPIFFIAKG